MRICSFDWATRKALTCYDSQTQKVKQIPNSIEEFEKFLINIGGGIKKKLKNSNSQVSLSNEIIMLFEFGGGDTFKIMAFRAGHTVLQVPGKKIKDYRDRRGEEKSDEIDARLIYEFYMQNGGSAKNIMRNSITSLPPSNEINKRGSAASTVKNSIYFLPSPFYPFKESNAEIAEVKILFREHEDLKKDMVREKLKRIAFEQKFKIAKVADDRIKKMLFHKDASIVAKEKEVEQLKKVLEKKVKAFDIWDKHLKNIKAVGPVIASGLIGELGGKHFDSDESLKHYCGMVAKSEFHDYNRYVKVILYQFAEQVIRHRTPKWRKLYDGIKLFYAEKHDDWSKGKVNNYAKKFVQTKFLIWFWQKWEE